MLARTLAAKTQSDLRAVVEAYASWYASGPFDIGTTTSRALSAASAAATTARRLPWALPAPVRRPTAPSCASALWSSLAGADRGDRIPCGDSRRSHNRRPYCVDAATLCSRRIGFGLTARIGIGLPAHPPFRLWFVGLGRASRLIELLHVVDGVLEVVLDRRRE